MIGRRRRRRRLIRSAPDAALLPAFNWSLDGRTVHGRLSTEALSFISSSRANDTHTHTHTHTQRERERVFKRDKCHRPVTSVTLLGIVAVVTNDSANWCRYESCRWPPAPQPPADNVVGVVVIVVVLFPRSRRRHRAAGPERGDSSQGPASDSLPTPIITFQGSFFLFVFFFFFFFLFFFAAGQPS